MAEFSIYHLLSFLLYNLSIIYYYFVCSWASLSKIDAGWLLSVSAPAVPAPPVIHCWIYKCACFCVCGGSSNVSSTEIHPVTPHVFLASPSGVRALPCHIQRTDKRPDVLPAISASHPCLSPNRNSPPPSLILSFSPSVQLPS